MPKQKYIRPPVVQALFEARFADPLDFKKVQKFIKNISKLYPSSEEGKKLDVNIGEKGEVTGSSSTDGYKLSSTDGTDVILIRHNSLTVGRLAPYEGWDSFLPVMKRNWEVGKKAFGYKRLNRLALRYINRIDIPHIEGDITEESDYLNISIDAPKDTAPVFHNYNITFTSKTKSDFFYNIKSGPSSSPIVDHLSIVLDLDIYKTEGLPKKDEEIWEFVDELRREKNDLFESFITDRSRELFDREI